MKKFKKWMDKSTTQEKERLAKSAKTSVGLLYQLASGDRAASAGLAGQIETAMNKLHPAEGIERAEFCEACARCPYFKGCKDKTNV